MTAASLLPDNRIELIGKGGRRDVFTLSSDLHAALLSHLAHSPARLADLRGYQAAYRRAVLATGSRVTGTHGARRASARTFYARRYAEARTAGLAPAPAADQAAGDAIERLGHSRDRTDHRSWYLDR